MSGGSVRIRLFVLLGDPVDHSLSPDLQNAAMRRADIDASYAALSIRAELVPPVMRAVAEAGGGGNVTLPHKRIAAAALDQPTAAVRATGACNLFWWEPDSGLCGDNTDVEAFGGAARAVLERPLEGRRMLVVGAGGAARAAVYAAIEAGVRRLDLLNRTRSRAQSLYRDLGEPEALHLLASPEEAFEDEYDLVVNATSLGLREGDPLPIDPGRLRAASALDLVYSTSGTPWVRAARSHDIPAEDGRRMLVLQAAAAFRRWFGRPPPPGAMEGVVGVERVGR